MKTAQQNKPASTNVSRHEEGTLMHSLLTENRFWTFWKLDWTDKVYVQWGGKTKFKDVIASAKKKLNLKKGEECQYERQVQIKEPQLILE